MSRYKPHLSAFMHSVTNDRDRRPHFVFEPG